MARRFVPTKVHALVDYLTAPALLGAPDVLHMDARGASIPARVVGAAAGVHGPLTNYELGVKRLVPMRLHLALDLGGGALLAAAPFVTGAYRKGVRNWVPDALFGAAEIGLALTTKTAPPKRERKLGRIARSAFRPVTTAVAAVGIAAAVTATRR
jgi:hypothetical protein